MTARRPLCRIAGATKELPVGDKSVGYWSKAIAVPAGGAVSATIPAGIFTALPILKHTIQATGTRDYVFRLSGLTLNADKTITVSGVIRQSRTLPASILTLLALQGFDTFEAATTAVTLHLSAEESD